MLKKTFLLLNTATVIKNNRILKFKNNFIKTLMFRKTLTVNFN